MNRARRPGQPGQESGSGRWGRRSEGVEFAIFAARIDTCRKIAKKGSVQFPPGEGFIEFSRIDAGSEGAEAIFHEPTGQFTRVYFPDGEKRGHVCKHKFLFTIDAQVFQENIAEADVKNSLFAKTQNRFGHACLVDRIGTLLRNADFFDRQANGFGLPVKEFVADTVHADALVALGHGGQ